MVFQSCEKKLFENQSQQTWTYLTKYCKNISEKVFAGRKIKLEKMTILVTQLFQYQVLGIKPIILRPIEFFCIFTFRLAHFCDWPAEP